MSAHNPDAGKLRVTLRRSIHGQLANITQSVRGLGLRKRHQTVVVADTPENRGLIRTARHLLAVQQEPAARSGRQ